MHNRPAVKRRWFESSLLDFFQNRVFCLSKKRTSGEQREGARFIPLDINYFQVSGQLNFETIGSILAASQRDLQAQCFTRPRSSEKVPVKLLSPIRIDLSAVSYSDSSGLALLLHWLRWAQLNQQTLLFTRMPTQMQALADFFYLRTLLPIDCE